MYDRCAAAGSVLAVVALSCHILLRLKSYSNDVKSHYVVILFVCTR